jgi:hypothetical protein
MSKKRKGKSKRAKAAVSPQPSQFQVWLEQHPGWSATAVFLLLALIFFNEVLFQGKTFLTPDMLAPSALARPLRQALWGDGIYPLWQPYVFSGMPSFASLMYNPLVYIPYWFLEPLASLLPEGNLLPHVLHYPLAALGMFLLLRSLKVGFWGGVLGGVAFMFTPYLVTMEVFGHGSQMMTAAYLPLIVWAVMQLLQRRSLIHFLIAGLAIGLQLQRGHVQIVYYTWMVIGLYFLYHLWRSWRQEKALGELGRTTAWFAGALVLAIALAAVLYLPVYNYTPFSIRGGTGMEGGDTGAGVQYATQWSFHPKEMMTFLVPSFFGFGGQTYWGAMPFTDYPNYMGIVVLGLAIFAAVQRRRQPPVGFFLVVIALSLLVSFGRHFAPFYRLLYDYLPFFNKFRVPAMILIVVQFSVALLAGLGLQSLLDLGSTVDRIGERGRRIFRGVALFVAGLALLALLATLARQGFEELMAGIYPDRYPPQIQSQLDQERVSMLLKDLWLVTLFLAGSLALVWGFLNRKLAGGSFAAILSLLVLVDLWVVDFKLNKPRDASFLKSYLSDDETTRFLKQDQELFRVFPVADLFGENRWAAQEIATIGGYHPAKLRVYQDFLDAIGLPNDFLRLYYREAMRDGRRTFEPIPPDEQATPQFHSMWSALNMLNVQYLVSRYPIPDPSLNDPVAVTRYQTGRERVQVQIYRNPGALPRAFLVDRYQVLAEKEKVFAYLRSGRFDPAEEVILAEPPELEPQPGSGQVQVVERNLHTYKLKVSSGSPKLLVLSEAYYPHGWRAYVDGTEVPIYQANYVLRAVAVPAGEHEVLFNFAPEDFKIGAAISLSALLFTIVGFVVVWRKRE